MSRMKPAFFEAVAIVKATYDAPNVRGVVECSRQGFASATYLITFHGAPSKILQLRDAKRPVPLENIEKAKRFLGDHVPECRFLKRFATSEGREALAYEMSAMAGVDLGTFMARPDIVSFLPTIAKGLGSLLGRCSTGEHARVPEATCQGIEEFMGEEAFSAYKEDITSLLASYRLLAPVPMAITNFDVSFTNILIREDGTVSGLVDWESFGEAPLGYDLMVVHWLRGTWDNCAGLFVARENGAEIENAFWTAFYEEALCSITDGFVHGVEICMKVRAAESYTYPGTRHLWPAGQLRMELDYHVPRMDVTG